MFCDEEFTQPPSVQYDMTDCLAEDLFFDEDDQAPFRVSHVKDRVYEDSAGEGQVQEGSSRGGDNVEGYAFDGGFDTDTDFEGGRWDGLMSTGSTSNPTEHDFDVCRYTFSMSASESECELTTDSGMDSEGVMGGETYVSPSTEVGNVGVADPFFADFVPAFGPIDERFFDMNSTRSMDFNVSVVGGFSVMAVFSTLPLAFGF